MERKSFTPFWVHNNIEIDKDQLSIILLAHVQKPRGHINRAQLQCSEPEHFSIKELMRFIKAL